MANQWVKKYSPFLLSAILLITMACDATVEQFAGLPKKKIVTINEVTVTPALGPGGYVLELKYHHETNYPVTISCSYVGPDKNTMGIMTVDDDGKTGFMDITQKKVFDVHSTGEKPEPGVYTATCADEFGQSSKSTTFTVGEDDSADVSILKVQVAEGQKYNYALEFMYVIRIPDDVAFTCNYLSPTGATIFIDDYTDTHHLEDPLTRSMFFSVKQADGKVIPGSYTATCQDDQGRSKKSTSFVVSEEPTPTVEPSPEVTFTPPFKLPPSGKILFDFSQAASDRAGAGGELKRVTELCVPDIQISLDGEIFGKCEKTHIQALLVDESITATVEGAVDSKGNLSFTYKVTETGHPNGSWNITYNEKGAVMADNAAAGSADFGFDCKSGQENLIWCWKWTSETFSGTIPWQFEPSP
ncbi:MAG: hypothetical protein AB9891_03370 [Anaerolineaceae bacterium]